jgi:electron transfer flavoprotein alpha subunit
MSVHWLPNSKNWELPEMTILVWAEHDNTALKDATLSAITAAAQLGEVHVLVAGASVECVAQAAAGIVGVAKVLTADDRYTPTPWRRTSRLSS